MFEQNLRQLKKLSHRNAIVDHILFAQAFKVSNRVSVILVFLLGGLLQTAIAEITVTQPSGSLIRVAQGQDFATYIMANPWDMQQPEDIILTESMDLVGETFADGVYSFVTGSNDNRFWTVFPGLIGAFRGLETGERYPISTDKYRYLSVKVRMRRSDGQPLEETQPFVARFFEDSDWQTTGNVGVTAGRRSTYEDWTVIEWDLADPGDLQPNSNIQWTDVPLVRGLRFNPTKNADVKVEIDWIRLTAESLTPSGPALEWENAAGSGPYEIVATDGEFVHVVASGVTGNQTEVDLRMLPSGEYQIGVTDGQSTDFAAATVAINDVPVLRMTVPDRKGDQSRAYGITETGNAWTSIDADDILDALGMTGIRYDNPVGSLTARPTGSDPRILFDTTVDIDTTHYRMLCYTLQVAGPRDIGLGSVARLFWGNNRPSLSTGKDIVVQEGLNEYCVGDLTDFPTEGTDEGWGGTVKYIRIDPHEFPVSDQCTQNPTPENCRDIRLDSFVLSPFHVVPGSIELQWESFDRDDDAIISLYYDTDLVPFNGNEGVIIENLAQSEAGGSFSWQTSAVPEGLYNILTVIDDGRNRTIRYATGPVQVVADSNEIIFQDRFE